jgi:hypothetical protein
LSSSDGDEEESQGCPGYKERNMADKNVDVKVDLAGASFVLGVFVLLILFWGKPDLHDAIIHRLMAGSETSVETGK